jgi:hypothetical protein
MPIRKSQRSEVWQIGNEGMMLQNEMPEKSKVQMVVFEFQERENIELQQGGSVRRLYPPTNGTGSPGVRNGFLPNSLIWSINDSPRIPQLFYF